MLKPTSVNYLTGVNTIHHRTVESSKAYLGKESGKVLTGRSRVALTAREVDGVNRFATLQPEMSEKVLNKFTKHDAQKTLRKICQAKKI